MMSSFTTLKKNSRFKSACPSSGPITFCEGGPSNLVQVSIVALNRLVPQPVLPPSVRDPSHVYARSPATSTHAAACVHARSFRCTNLCNCLSASVGIFAAAVRLYSAAPLWVSRHQTLSLASSASGSLLFGRMHQRPPPLMGRQQPLLLGPFLTCTSGPFR